MWHIGLDYHVRTSSLHILDDRGAKVKSLTVRGGWAELLAELSGIAAEAERAGQKLAVCYEASCGYGHLFERLSKVASRVVVAHPGQLRLIFKAKRKNDRVDAAKLAMLLFMDQVPAVWVPDVEARGWRRLIEYRRRLIDKRTRVKNQLRSAAADCGPMAWNRHRARGSGPGRTDRRWRRRRCPPTAMRCSVTCCSTSWSTWNSRRGG